MPAPTNFAANAAAQVDTLTRYLVDAKAGYARTFLVDTLTNAGVERDSVFTISMGGGATGTRVHLHIEDIRVLRGDDHVPSRDFPSEVFTRNVEAGNLDESGDFVTDTDWDVFLDPAFGSDVYSVNKVYDWFNLTD